MRAEFGSRARRFRIKTVQEFFAFGSRILRAAKSVMYTAAILANDQIISRKIEAEIFRASATRSDPGPFGRNKRNET